jgi:hypothetical protein
LIKWIDEEYIVSIFNEDTKDFPNTESDAHFLSSFNYFVGARFTVNRANMKPTSVNSGNSTYEFLKRESNYEGQTNSSYSDVEKTPFGKADIEYTGSGGYSGEGGYVLFLRWDTKYEMLRNIFFAFVADGLFDEKFISLTLESIFYNENYQTGIHIAYMFMYNNAGDLEVYQTTHMYQNSRYHFEYERTKHAYFSPEVL